MPHPRTTRPNIVIFMMDTQGSRNMSCYGYHRQTTPNIDRIAKEGVLFERHFVTAPWTLPVHASLFTGRYQCGHGAGGAHEALEPGLPQMGEVFTKNGYRTVALCNNGWAYNSDPEGGSAGTGFQEHIRYGNPKVKPVAPYIPSDDPNEQDNGSLKAVGVATKWIDDHAIDTDDPFLMFINCTEPHDPYRPPEPFRSRFLDATIDFKKAFARRGGQAISSFGDRAQTLDEWHIERQLYDGETACLDDRIGKFVGELRARGIYDDTIFIVTGDHGDVQGEQAWYAYHSQHGVWDRTCQTPLVIRYPKKFGTGKRCKELVQINDIFPTLMQIAGIKDAEASASIQGESLLKALKGPVRDFALIESQRGIHPMRRAWQEAQNPDEVDVRFMNRASKAARGKRWKYVWQGNGDDMLFDIANDPDERFNIMDRKPQVALKMRKQLEDKLMSLEQRYFQDLTKPSALKAKSPIVLRRLQAWGLFQSEGVIPPWDPKVQEKWEAGPAKNVPPQQRPRKKKR